MRVAKFVIARAFSYGAGGGGSVKQTAAGVVGTSVKNRNGHLALFRVRAEALCGRKTV